VKKLILASSSRYRSELLQRLRLPFATFAPEVDETPLEAETPANLVTRLAERKARSFSVQNTQSGASSDAALVIGSDQVADLNGEILGKPGSVDGACQQLAKVSGQSVWFRTGLCLLDTETGQCEIDRVDVGVRFRALSHAEIERYVDADQPLDCAGSFRSEGLGIALLDEMPGSDPTALIGLPLIRLSQMLRAAGIAVP